MAAWVKIFFITCISGNKSIIFFGPTFGPSLLQKIEPPFLFMSLPPRPSIWRKRYLYSPVAHLFRCTIMTFFWFEVVKSKNWLGQIFQENLGLFKIKIATNNAKSCQEHYWKHFVISFLVKLKSVIERLLNGSINWLHCLSY